MQVHVRPSPWFAAGRLDADCAIGSFGTVTEYAWRRGRGWSSLKLPRLACWLCCCASYPHGNPNFAKSIAATLHGWEASASCSSISFVPRVPVLPAAGTYDSSRPSGLSFFDFDDGFFRYFALLYFTTSAHPFAKEIKRFCVHLGG